MSIETVSPGKLTLICSGMDARPLFWTEADGTRHGYEPAAAEAMARAMGMEIDWLCLQWADFVPALMDERGDAIWCGSAITPERERLFLYSRPYAVFNESALVREGEGITDPQHLSGKRVGAIVGSTNMALAESWPGTDHVGFDGATDDVLGDMIAALRAGDIDAVVDDDCAFVGISDDSGLDVAFTIETRNRWGAAMRPGSDQLKAAFDRALDHVILSQGLSAIWKSWFPKMPYPAI